jgi:pimeloyl-ACP methyl ester carboxylesterase
MSGAPRDGDSVADRRHQTLRLGDGRTLGYAEYGDPAGVPLFVLHGLPGSRLAVEEMWHEETAGLRVIAPDRPGFGLSSRRDVSGFTDWVADLCELADALGIETFHLAGFSGGGPFALAAAAAQPRRVAGVLVIAGAGPLDRPETFRQLLRSSRVLFTLARRAPWMLRPLVGLNARAMRRHPARVLEAARRSRDTPDADREVMSDPHFAHVNLTAGPESFRQGTRATVREVLLNARAWDFDPGSITRPVRMWHGTADRNVPIAIARAVAARVPGATLAELEGEGHLIVPRHWGEIVGTVIADA